MSNWWVSILNPYRPFFSICRFWGRSTNKRQNTQQQTKNQIWYTWVNRMEDESTKRQKMCPGFLCSPWMFVACANRSSIKVAQWQVSDAKRPPWVASELSQPSSSFLLFSKHVRQKNVFFYCLLIDVSDADCYFAFLQPSGGCSSDSDCGGSPCVMDVKAGSHVCCKPKPGTIAPRMLWWFYTLSPSVRKHRLGIFPISECPGGMTFSGIPVLCDPADGDDGCPAGYTCKSSTTDFTKACFCRQFLCSHCSPEPRSLPERARVTNQFSENCCRSVLQMHDTLIAGFCIAQLAVLQVLTKLQHFDWLKLPHWLWITVSLLFRLCMYINNLEIWFENGKIVINKLYSGEKC